MAIYPRFSTLPPTEIMGKVVAAILIYPPTIEQAFELVPGVEGVQGTSAGEEEDQGFRSLLDPALISEPSAVYLLVWEYPELFSGEPPFQAIL